MESWKTGARAGASAAECGPGAACDETARIADAEGASERRAAFPSLIAGRRDRPAGRPPESLAECETACCGRASCMLTCLNSGLILRFVQISRPTVKIKI